MLPLICRECQHILCKHIRKDLVFERGPQWDLRSGMSTFVQGPGHAALIREQQLQGV